MWPSGYVDLRAFLETDDDPDVPPGTLRSCRPDADQLARTAFTSGTTGNPKAVLHTHNTTNCALRFLNRGQRISADSVLLVFLPVGLNWGLFNVLQAIEAGCRVILQDVFRPEEALALICQRAGHALLLRTCPSGWQCSTCRSSSPTPLPACRSS